ncbi:MAG TPA: acyl-CoA dehydrogenase family protein [Dehalococcoidia bacterium]|nr:acyl-CoA dehydrogenase family protein [Dehalococcoidia bacterium]
MDFRFSPEQEAFREEVRDFLRRTLTPEFWANQRKHRLPGWSPEFSHAVAERGWLGIAWPEEFGGQNRSIIDQMIYQEEMAYAGAPQEHHRRAVQQIAPSLMIFGDEEQKQEYLPRIARAEISFAMGLSEPNAGSDLAAVETRAVRDGDTYVVSGRKRFTSGAHFSDFLWTVVRTDTDAPKHRGISMLIVPLDAPGVDIRPLYDMQGRRPFNEVFLNEVRVPIKNRVGEENRGWYVNATTMDFERSGIARIANLRRLLDRCVRALRNAGEGTGQQARHRVARLQLAEFATAVEVSRLLSYRVAWMQSNGWVPNYEVSIQKVLATETDQKIANFILNYHGLYGLLTEGREDVDDLWGPTYLGAVSATIGQGASEIQRNVIATRGLGLPRD